MYSRPSPGLILALSLLASATFLFLLTSTTYEQLPTFQSNTSDLSPADSACSTPSLCNPFMSHGYITPSPKSFLPISDECPAALDIPALLPTYLSGLRNKTFYFYGDSVARMIMSDFCSYIRGAYRRLPDPPGFLTSSDLQAIHTCRVDALNFTAVNLYHYGLQKWDNTSSADVHFLMHHPSIQYKHDPNPVNWYAETRISIPQPTLSSTIGAADAAFMLTGMWDLPSLQRSIVGDYLAHNTTQTDAPPESWLQAYQDRLRTYISTVRTLHAGRLRKLYWISLHDPGNYEKDTDPKSLVGLQGMPADWFDKPKFSAISEVRVRALRNLQLQVAREMGADVLPYHLWMKAAPKRARMRDSIHPSAWLNELFTLAAVMEAGRMEVGC